MTDLLSSSYPDDVTTTQRTRPSQIHLVADSWIKANDPSFNNWASRKVCDDVLALDRIHQVSYVYQH